MVGIYGLVEQQLRSQPIRMRRELGVLYIHYILYLHLPEPVYTCIYETE